MPRAVRFAMLLGAAWVTMVITHEVGHIVGGWIGGATLVDYDLVPWRLPYSLHSPDPLPLLTLWSGPVVGVLVPLVFALIARRRWAWFIADFCALANGVYLALAWIAGDRYLDTPRLLDAGAHPATLVFYCGVTMVVGYRRFRSDCVRLLSTGSAPAEPPISAKAERTGLVADGHERSGNSLDTPESAGT